MNGETVRATVTGYRFEIRNGVTVPHPQCSQAVDDQGNFRCERLQAGVYVLVITLPGSHWSDNSSSQSYDGAEDSVLLKGMKDSEPHQAEPSLPLFVCFPSAARFDNGSMIHLAADQTQVANIEIDTRDVAILQVTPVHGTNGAHMQFFVEGDDFSIPLDIQPKVDRSGKNYLWRGILPGHYRLVENWAEKGQPHEAVRTLTVAEATVSETSVNETQLYELHGTAIDQDKLPSAISKVILEPLTGEHLGQRYSGSVQSDGSFNLKGIPEGLYRIALPIEDERALDQAYLGDKPLTDLSVMVGDGTSEQQLVLTAKHGLGTVNGVLKLDGSETRPGVVLQSLESRSAIVIPVREDGSFAIHGLPRGEYRIYGWADVRSVPYNSITFLARYAEHSATLLLEEGSTVTHLEVECSRSDL
ncbi:hypothetical protein HDF16_006147 [Granulicella aggregans]|uniref:Carboxypeptidase family protein n=1 Tax=Granulicella aggregans TaxID=474949 RepID=A0A7W8E777_9BACT|nr:hypothetical protein [Granulicella aggregans]MBB5061411.1 hypothetical protein [Granulicella aggregans]